MYYWFLMKLHVLIVKIQSMQNTYVTSEMPWESSPTSDNSSYWLRYAEQSNLRHPILPPISTGLSIVDAQARRSGFKSIHRHTYHLLFLLTCLHSPLFLVSIYTYRHTIHTFMQLQARTHTPQHHHHLPHLVHMYTFVNGPPHTSTHLYTYAPQTHAHACSTHLCKYCTLEPEADVIYIYAQCKPDAKSMYVPHVYML